MIYSIIISVCALSVPGECRVYEQPVTELSPNPVMAFVQAQTLVAQWSEQHPGLAIRNWHLEPGRGA
jgi:hypothetical protein